MKFELRIHDHDVCDFCSDPHPVCVFQCESFMVEKEEPMPVESIEGWCACQPCSFLIKEDRWAEMERRAYMAFIEKYPELSPSHHLEVVQKMQRLFREHMRRSA